MTNSVILAGLGGSQFLLLLFLAGFVFLGGKITKWIGYPFWTGAITTIVLFLGIGLFLAMYHSSNKFKPGDIKIICATVGLCITALSVMFTKAKKTKPETKQCTFCGNEILAVAKKCKHCGEWLNDTDTEAPKQMMAYYCLEGDEKHGPLSVDQLKSFCLKPDTLIWREGFDDWKQLCEVEELKILINGKLMPEKPTRKKSLKMLLIIGGIVVVVASVIIGIILSKTNKMDDDWLRTEIVGMYSFSKTEEENDDDGLVLITINGEIGFNSDGGFLLNGGTMIVTFIDEDGDGITAKYALWAWGKYEIKNSYIVYDIKIDDIEINLIQTDNQQWSNYLNDHFISQAKHEMFVDNKERILELNDNYLKTEIEFEGEKEIVTYVRLSREIWDDYGGD